MFQGQECSRLATAASIPLLPLPFFSSSLCFCSAVGVSKERCMSCLTLISKSMMRLAKSLRQMIRCSATLQFKITTSPQIKPEESSKESKGQIYKKFSLLTLQVKST